MISGFARAYQVLGDTRYVEAAVNAGNFIRKQMYDGDSGVLQRRHRDGEAAIEGYADDYAFLIKGLLDLYEFQLGRPRQIVIAGSPNAADTQALLREVNARFIPNKVVLLADGAGGQKALARRFEFIASLRPIDGKAAAYVCENGVCKLPTTDPAALAALLDGSMEVPKRSSVAGGAE